MRCWVYLEQCFRFSSSNHQCSQVYLLLCYAAGVLVEPLMESQEQLKLVPHVTALILELTCLDSQATEIAQELAALSGVQMLQCDCLDIRRALFEVQLWPFAACLSSFQCLTALKWPHTHRLEPLVNYLEELSASLEQLLTLRVRRASSFPYDPFVPQPR